MRFNYFMVANITVDRLSKHCLSEHHVFLSNGTALPHTVCVWNQSHRNDCEKEHAHKWLPGTVFPAPAGMNAYTPHIRDHTNWDCMHIYIYIIIYVYIYIYIYSNSICGV